MCPETPSLNNCVQCPPCSWYVPSLWELDSYLPGKGGSPKSWVHQARVYSGSSIYFISWRKDECEDRSLVACLWTCSFLRWCRLLVQSRVCFLLPDCCRVLWKIPLGQELPQGQHHCCPRGPTSVWRVAGLLRKIRLLCCPWRFPAVVLQIIAKEARHREVLWALKQGLIVHRTCLNMQICSMYLEIGKFNNLTFGFSLQVMLKSVPRLPRVVWKATQMVPCLQSFVTSF